MKWSKQKDHNYPREDFLEKRDTAYERRLQIQKLYNLREVPSQRQVEALLNRIERYKATGLVA